MHTEGIHIALNVDDTKIWARQNPMKFLPSKCKALSITYQRSIYYNLPFIICNYKLGSDFIDYVSSQVDLGITITNKLLWSNHHDTVISKATAQLGLLMRTCHFTIRFKAQLDLRQIDLKQKITFYLTLITDKINL